jgi:hypothetical protein
MEEQFIKGNSDNLPRVDMHMMHEYYINNINYFSAEIKGVKNLRFVSIALILAIY